MEQLFSNYIINLVQHTCLKKMCACWSLPSRTYTQISSPQNPEEQGNLTHFTDSCHNPVHFPSLLSKHFFFFPLQECISHLQARWVFQPSLFLRPSPPHSWLISCFLPQALADKIGVGCSLVRGEYGRAWNEVKLMSESRKGVMGALPPLEVYIVDLMFHPGSLIKLRSREADHYRFL